MKPLFIVNPISGGVDKTHVLEDISSLCELHDIDYRVFIWDRVSDLKESFQDFDVDRIIVVGGDGTLNFSVTNLAYLGVPFGFVSLGSANGTAKEINLSTNSFEALTDAVFSENLLETDVIDINGNICIHLSDIGTNAELVEKFDKEPERGFMSYAKHLFSTLIETQEKDFFIISNGETYEWTGYMLTFANASKYGSGIIINPNGNMSDGFFELCNVKDLSIEALLMMGFTKYSDNISLTEYIDQIKTTKAIVETKQPYLLQIDGEVIGEFSKFEIEIKPNFFRFVIP